MSVILLDEAKDFLDVIHSADDDKLQSLLDGAEAEALEFMDRDDFYELCGCESSSEESSSSSSQEMPADVVVGCLLLLQASYQASPADAQQLRDLAEIKLMPHRCKLGV